METNEIHVVFYKVLGPYEHRNVHGEGFIDKKKALKRFKQLIKRGYIKDGFVKKKCWEISFVTCPIQDSD